MQSAIGGLSQLARELEQLASQYRLAENGDAPVATHAPE